MDPLGGVPGRIPWGDSFGGNTWGGVLGRIPGGSRPGFPLEDPDPLRVSSIGSLRDPVGFMCFGLICFDLDLRLHEKVETDANHRASDKQHRWTNALIGREASGGARLT